MKVGSNEFEIVVVSSPSRPESQGRGHCGAGEEIKIKIFHQPKKKIFFEKLIASCLQAIELETDSGNKKPIEAVKITKTGVEILWFSRDGKTEIKCIINLEKDKPRYSETSY